MKKKYMAIKNNKGFSLVEMMIVIFVVGVGLVGVVSFFNASLASQMNVKNELIANGLAQEGAELVRNLRDYRVLNGASWNDLFDPANQYRLTKCTRIDYRSLTTNLHDCYVDSQSSKICFVGGKYQQCDNAGDAGIGMTRTISVTYDSTEKCLIVNSTINWSDRTIVAKDFLYENEF